VSKRVGRAKTGVEVDKIKALHVYDFDNTLFRTPLPNPALWNGSTIGLLSNQDIFVNGGWWHDNRILASTGQGLDKEERRAWEGFWNEKIVELVNLTVKQPDALCVLLTGRSEKGFSDLLKRMVASKGLDIDMVCLKPQAGPANQRFQSTMHFKQTFLTSLMETYRKATEIKVYEDRPKHTNAFRDFFATYNRKQTESPTRGSLAADVVQVADALAYLDPVVEVAEVQHMINDHNDAILKQPYNKRRSPLKIKRTVFFTSYMVGAEDSQKLMKLVSLPSNIPESDLKYHGNNILICPRPCPPSILEKVGGMGSKMMWEVVATACFEDSIWAVRVRPVPSSAPYHSENPVPLVVLALRRGARPVDAGRITSWKTLPAEKCFIFETVVSEKVILRIESDDPREGAYESLFANKHAKRKHTGDDDRPFKNGHGQSRGFHSGARGGARGRGGNANRGPRGGGRGNGRGGRGRGGFNYRSLDDVDPKGHQNAPGAVNYDDAFPAMNQSQTKSSGSNQTAPAWAANQQQSQGRPMGGQGSNNADLQNYY
jgi:hypothetical protein